MPSPVQNVTALSQAIQYTGTNSADLDAQVPNSFIVSEIGNVLTLNHNGSDAILNVGDWLIYDMNGHNVFSNTQFLAERFCVALCSDVSISVKAMGISLVPALDPSDSVLVPVLISPAMSDASYTAFVSKFSSVSVSDLAINSVTVVDADTVNVLVQNMGLATISGASIMVHAIG